MSDSSYEKRNRKRKKSREKSKDKDLMNEKRTYEVALDDRMFTLEIEMDKKHLKFSTHEICSVYHQVYKNKYDLEQIVKRLNLVKSKYTSLSRLIKFFDTAYSKNKIFLEQKEDEDLYITILVPVDFEEERYSLHLKSHKLDDSEILPMLMNQINRLNNNNAIVKKNFNEIERQIDTISKKSVAKQGFGSSNNINKELDIIKKELYDINGKLGGSNKMDNLYESNNDREINFLKSSYNKIQLKNSSNNFKNKEKNGEKIYLNKDSKKNRKYGNQRYDDKNEDEKDDSLDMYVNNNKSRKGKEDSNKKRTKLKSSQNDMNEVKKSLKYINNKEEKKYDENEIENLKGSNSLKFKKGKGNMIINDENNSYEDEDNREEDEKESYNNKNDYKLRGGKKMVESSNSNTENDYEKKDLPKILYVNKTSSELEVYKKKTKIEYESAPINLNYKDDICKNNTSSGWNDMFEVYISYQNNKAYLASPNQKNFKIDIYLLDENKKETSLKGHKNNVRTIRYFLNKDKKEKEENKELIQEYLISADDNKIVIVWDVLNRFEIKQLIDTNYEDDIYSCALFFNKNTERNYIVTSTYNTSSDITSSATKLYSLATGEYGYYIKESNFDNIYYLLIWLNPKDNQNYLIQFSFKKIIINNLEKGKDQIYAKLTHEPENEHYSGYLFSKDDSEFLCTTCYNGFIHVWNLYTKKLSNIIDTKIIMCHIIPWNEKFAIAADFENKSFVIIDLEEKKIYKGKQIEHKMEVKCVKKIRHSEFGECLLTAGRDHNIKLWAL